MTIYPYNKDTQNSLLNAANDAYSALAAAFNIGDSSFTVVDGSAFPTGRHYVSVDTEIVLVSSRSGNTLFVEQRGADNTSQANHIQGRDVYHNVVAGYHDTIRDAILATQAEHWTWRSPIESTTVNDPSILIPSDGQSWIVASVAVGDWAGREGSIAVYDSVSGWDFIAPEDGFTVWSKANDTGYVYNGSAWQPMGFSDHGDLSGLTDDDHTQYALLAGRAGGQSVTGGTGAGDDLTLLTTSNATKGSYVMPDLAAGGAGFLKNDGSGVLSGGNVIVASDISDLDTNDAVNRTINVKNDGSGTTVLNVESLSIEAATAGFLKSDGTGIVTGGNVILASDISDLSTNDGTDREIDVYNAGLGVTTVNFEDVVIVGQSAGFVKTDIDGRLSGGNQIVFTDISDLMISDAINRDIAIMNSGSGVTTTTIEDVILFGAGAGFAKFDSDGRLSGGNSVLVSDVQGLETNDSIDRDLRLLNNGAGTTTIIIEALKIDGAGAGFFKTDVNGDVSFGNSLLISDLSDLSANDATNRAVNFTNAGSGTTTVTADELAISGAAAGFVKSDASGFLSGGNSVLLADIGDLVTNNSDNRTISIKNDGVGTTTVEIEQLQLLNPLGTSYGGTGLTSFTANAVFYASDASTVDEVTPNITTTTRLLSQSGNGASASAPEWGISVSNNTSLGSGSDVVPTQLAVKTYVDNVSQGLQVKAAVEAGTTGNVTLSGEQTIDDISLVTGDRVLVKDQTDPTENGIYVVDSGAWSRSADADSWPELVAAYVLILDGTVNGGNSYFCSAQAGGTIGVDDVDWTIFSTSVQTTAVNVGSSGVGVFDNKNGNILEFRKINPASSRVSITLDAPGQKIDIDIAEAQLNLASIGGTLTVSQGGTGATGLTGIVVGNGAGAFTATAGTASQFLRRNAGNTAYEFTTLAFTDVAGTLSVSQGGTGITSLTGAVIGNGTSQFSAVAGTANQFLRRNAANTAYEFATIDFSVVSGTLDVASGGTGATSLTGALIGNGASAVTAVAGTANQFLRRNAANTAYEFATVDFSVISGVLTVAKGGTGTNTLTGIVVGNGTGNMTAVAGGASQFLRRNAGNTAYEFADLTFNAVSGTLSVDRGGTGTTSLTGALIGNGTSAVTAVSGTTKQYLRRNATNTAYEFASLIASDVAVSSGSFSGWLSGYTTSQTSFARLDSLAKDDAFYVANAADPTKIMLLDVSSVATGQTRTISVPDRDTAIGSIDLWATGTNYIIGDLITSSNSIYRCTTAHTAGATFIGDAANWQELSSGGGGSSFTSITVTGPDTHSASSTNAIIICDTNGGDVQVDLPSAATTEIYWIKNAGNGNVLLTPTGGALLDGETSGILPNQWDSVTLASDGTDWYVM